MVMTCAEETGSPEKFLCEVLEGIRKKLDGLECLVSGLIRPRPHTDPQVNPHAGPA